MRVLGIETSCDETAAAIIERRPDGTGRILANIVRSQLAEHAAYGGVVPEIAARAHVELLDNLIVQALAAANMRLADSDAIAATAGPGLIGGLLVGLTTAKTLALAAAKPFLPINHLEGHALTARLTDNVAFPYLLLLVSGGHTQIVLVKGLGQYQRLGTSLDDALGESFDKIARLLGLPYPGGPAVEQAAKKGRAEKLVLPRPLKGEPGCDFSFSGLKTAVRRAALLSMEDNGRASLVGGAPQDKIDGERARATEGARNEQTEGVRASMQNRHGEAGGALPAGISGGSMEKGKSGQAMAAGERPALDEQQIADICAAFQAAIIETILDRLHNAFALYRRLVPAKAGRQPVLVAAGGVAANGALRCALQDLCAAQDFAFVAPPLALCSDNAAMIAWAGAEHLAAQGGRAKPAAGGRAGAAMINGLDFAARARWPLDMSAPAKIGSGRKGAKA